MNEDSDQVRQLLNIRSEVQVIELELRAASAESRARDLEIRQKLDRILALLQED